MCLIFHCVCLPMHLSQSVELQHLSNISISQILCKVSAVKPLGMLFLALNVVHFVYNFLFILKKETVALISFPNKAKATFML